MLLAADIGATKTAVALFSRQSGLDRPLASRTFASRDYPSLEALLRQFLQGSDARPAIASLGLPGPVRGRRAEITNLPWVVEARALERGLGIPAVRLLNDLAATAHALPSLRPDQLVTLQGGQADPAGNLAVVAPGTGLGEAFLVRDGRRHRPVASEGGHADFAPTTPLQLELLGFLLRSQEHVSYERVCSGSGLPQLYAFLRQAGRYPEPAWLTERLEAAEDPTPVIVEAAGEEPIARATLELLVEILGAEAGNLALRVMATGGVYLAGGLPPRLLPWLRRGPFLAAFRRKGRLAELLERVPVHVVTDPAVALRGAALHGLEQIEGLQESQT